MYSEKWYFTPKMLAPIEFWWHPLRKLALKAPFCDFLVEINGHNNLCCPSRNFMNTSKILIRAKIVGVWKTKCIKRDFMSLSMTFPLLNVQTERSNDKYVNWQKLAKMLSCAKLSAVLNFSGLDKILVYID